MRGNPRNQSGQIFRAISSIGHSRHAAKMTARAAGITGSHDIAQQIGVHSYATMKRYRQITAAFLTWCRDEYGIRDSALIKPEHVEHFLQVKISEGVRHSTYRTHCAALNKMSVGLSVVYRREYKWAEAIDRTRIQAREYLDQTVKSRSFRDPEIVIEHIEGAYYKLCAQCQYLGGMRSGEVYFTKRHLIGDCRLLLTNTKGGRRRVVKIPQWLYDQVADIVHKDGVFTVDYRQYLNRIKSACAASGEKYGGSHSFRWGFCQRTLRELQEGGSSYDTALKITAERMGHTRSTISERYAR